MFYVIGIDIGTTNCKVCSYNVCDFREILKISFNTPKVISNNNVDFDIKEIWKNIKIALKQSIDSLSSSGKVLSISIASVGESGVLIDERGEEIGPVIAWFDTRTETQYKASKRVIDSRDIYKICGLSAHSNYSVYKIKWLYDFIKESRAKKNKWMSIAGYIAYKLTGEIKYEYSLASRTMLLDISTGTWSEYILDKFNIDKNIMPDIVESGEVIGKVKTDLKFELGAQNDIQVSMGGHDHMCGAFGVGITENNDILNSTGTTEGLLLLSDKARLGEAYSKSKLSSGIYVLKGLNTIFGSIPAAGLCFQWMKENLFPDKTYEEIFNCISERDIESLVFVPHIRGSGPPVRDIYSKGLFYGLTDKTDKLHMAKAILEGVCFELNKLYTLINSKDITTMKVIGSAVNNPVWLQYKADVLGCNVEAFTVSEAVSRGAAMLGAYKLKYIDMEHIKKINKNLLKVYSPNYDKHKYFKNKYEKMYEPLYNLKLGYEKSMNGVI